MKRKGKGKGRRKKVEEQYKRGEVKYKKKQKS